MARGFVKSETVIKTRRRVVVPLWREIRRLAVVLIYIYILSYNNISYCIVLMQSRILYGIFLPGGGKWNLPVSDGYYLDGVDDGGGAAATPAAAAAAEGNLGKIYNKRFGGPMYGQANGR